MRFSINKKSIIILLSCILVVGVCVGVAVFVSGSRQYQMFTDSQSDTAIDGSSNTTPDSSGNSGTTVMETKGISITFPSDMPKTLDPIRYIKQAYELKNFMAIDSFSEAKNLPVNPAVQYAFCYLYAGSGCLVDYKPTTMTYREATEQEVQEQIGLLFGSCPFDIKASDLYSASKKRFEMWQPDYSCDVYATASLSIAETGDYKIEISYFESAAKAEATGSTVITVRQAEDGTFFLASMA